MFYAYEVFDPTGGYCLFIHEVQETFDAQYANDIDYLHNYHRLGTINAESLDEALRIIANDEWQYKEYNE